LAIRSALRKMHRNGLATTVFRRVRAQVDSEDRASHAEVAEWPAAPT
jgi:hypothetical protein